jgi:hypothetical protein
MHPSIVKLAKTVAEQRRSAAEAHKKAAAGKAQLQQAQQERLALQARAERCEEELRFFRAAESRSNSRASVGPCKEAPSATDSLAAMGAAHERAAVAEGELAQLQARANKLQSEVAAVRSETLDGFKGRLSTALAEVSSIEREVRLQVQSVDAAPFVPTRALSECHIHEPPTLTPSSQPQTPTKSSTFCFRTQRRPPSAARPARWDPATFTSALRCNTGASKHHAPRALFHSHARLILTRSVRELANKQKETDHLRAHVEVSRLFLRFCAAATHSPPTGARAAPRRVRDAGERPHPRAAKAAGGSAGYRRWGGFFGSGSS